MRAHRKRNAVRQVGFWWHSIGLGDGVVTPDAKSVERLRAELEALDLPDLRGKPVRDMGGWDGYFAFEADRRGAPKWPSSTITSGRWTCRASSPAGEVQSGGPYTTTE